MTNPSPRIDPGVLLTLLLAAGAGVLGLAFTNPKPQEFESFAADRLTDLLTRELCGNDGLPMLMRLMIRDCPGLGAAQHNALGRLAGLHTRRHNLGLMSLYTTAIGGQSLFGGLQVPRYHATTLALAGRFWMLHTEEDSSVGSRR